MTSKRLLQTRFYLFERDEFEALTESSGFRVESLYGGYAYSVFRELESPFMVWVLSK